MKSQVKKKTETSHKLKQYISNILLIANNILDANTWIQKIHFLVQEIQTAECDTNEW